MNKIKIFFMVIAVGFAMSSCSSFNYQQATVLVSQVINEYLLKSEADNGKIKVEDTADALYISKSRIENKTIIVTDSKGNEIQYTVKGVCVAPDIDGKMYFQTYKERIPLIKSINANSIRTYRPFGAKNDDGSLNYANTLLMLDECAREGISVAVGFSYEDMAPNGAMEEYLKDFGTHPAILMVVLGNEYNYHYGEWFTKAEWFSRLAYGIKTARTYAPGRIVATVHGEVPKKQEFDEYAAAGLDLVMMNIYRGSNFGFAKQDFYKMTDTMPWIVSEFGRSSRDGKGNDTSKQQASYLQSLIRSLETGGYLFMLVDDPEKGPQELSSIIGAEDSLGVFTFDLTPKIAAGIVMEEYQAKSK